MSVFLVVSTDHTTDSKMFFTINVACGYFCIDNNYFCKLINMLTCKTLFMKRIFLFTLLSIAFFSTALRAQVGKRWYSYTDYLDFVATPGAVDYVHTPIWNTPDNVDLYAGSTYGTNTTVSVGMSFAPRLTNWDNATLFGSSIKVGTTDVYTIDSVRIYGVYLRNNLKPGIKDTLKLALVYGNGATTTNLPEYNITTPLYGYTEYHGLQHDVVNNVAGKYSGSTVVPYTQNVILSNTDTASFFVRTIPLSTSFVVPAGQNAAMSLTFKSGDSAYTANDTVQYASGAYKYGAFRPYIGYHSVTAGGAADLAPYATADSNTGYFKVIIPSSTAWDGLYVPNWAFAGSTITTASQYQYPAIDFHVTCATCRLNDSIGGALAICIGNTATLTHSTTGGTWSSSTPSVATIGAATGIATGIASGTSSITYNNGGHLAISVVTVSPMPVVGAIVGASSVCPGSTITLTDLTPFGTWSSSAPGVAAVDSPVGIITGVTSGTSIITYTVSSYCATVRATKTVTVIALPDAGTIVGTTAVCLGATTALASTSPGGTWSSALGNASVTAGGMVTGVTAGTDIINYTVTNACGSVSTSVIVTINPVPSAGAISGPDAVCTGMNIVLSSTAAGGTWAAGNANATVATDGTVTGVTAGTVVITYAVTSAGCTSTTQTTVNIIDCPEGITDLSATQGEVSIFPNPAQDNITISATSSISSVEISNTVGQKVFSQQYKAPSVVVNIVALPQGIYFVKVNNSRVYKVIKQ